MKIENASIVNKDNKNYVVIDYREENKWKKTKIYGNIDIQKEMHKVKSLYQKNFPKFNFRLPTKEELLVAYVNNKYEGICVIRYDGKENFYPRCEGMIDQWITRKNDVPVLNDRIILVYPPPYRNLIEILHHELGHWFFDRVGNEMAKQFGLEDRRSISVVKNGIEIASFDNYTEMAALYCEEYFNGKKSRKTHHQSHLLRKLDEITKDIEFPLAKLMEDLEEKYKKRNVF